MDDVAAEARISRPGLYFLFTSKSGLFREAAERAISHDLAAAERALMGSDRPIDGRVVDAFDCWAGHYIGPMRDTTALIQENPQMLGPIALGGPQKFEALLTSALEQSGLGEQTGVMVRTLISLSLGVKHQAADRAEYRRRMTDAVRLLWPAESAR